jgi:hypothetical protein
VRGEIERAEREEREREREKIIIIKTKAQQNKANITQIQNFQMGN